jgi:hypothetical protein
MNVVCKILALVGLIGLSGCNAKPSSPMDSTAVYYVATQAPERAEDTSSDSARPAWVELTADKLPLHTDVVKSMPYATPEAARAQVLEKAAVRALDFAAEPAPKLKQHWQVPPWFVSDHMLREPIYVEEVDWDFGETLAPMYVAHAYLDLSPEKRELLLGKWRDELTKRRVNQIGGGLGFVLVCLVTLVTFLRLDDATRGYYSRLLATGAVAVVAGSAAALYTWIV